MENEFEFQYKTKDRANPTGKPKVYFTCHPQDFDRAFEMICADIFASHDCAIYYTTDMGIDIPEENRETDLNCMNLFVMPVTFRLLREPNRAMDSDFRFAMEKHIPVLPIMIESGIDEFYSAPDKFGALQYLNPFSSDLTEISYQEKLKNYLEAVLISDETAKRVREAFDAYVFLSYRKKDRRLANELMRLIHSRDELRDIAVWYDEFLTPGESFKKNIDRMLHDSRLFTLLVTPNLLEEPNGKPNFVMGEEYPEAKKISNETGMPILPAEMEPTDKSALAKKFAGLPSCVNTNDETFLNELLQTLSGIAKRVNDDEPIHNYLIGLAYLEGIDVERNAERAYSLIQSAAESGLILAMEKMVDLLSTGTGCDYDFSKAVLWKKKVVDYYSNIHNLDCLEKKAILYEELADLLEIQNEKSAGRYYQFALDVYKLYAKHDLKCFVRMLKCANKLIEHLMANGNRILTNFIANDLLNDLEMRKPQSYNENTYLYAEMYFFLSVLYGSTAGNSEQEFNCLKEAEKIFDSYSLQDEQVDIHADILIHLALYYKEVSGDEKNTLHYLQKTIALLSNKTGMCNPANKINRIKRIIKCYKFCINELTEQAQFQQAFEWYKEAIRYLEQFDLAELDYIGKEIGDLYNDFGSLLHSLGYTLDAKEYFLSAIEIYNTFVKTNPNKYEPGLAVLYFNFALCASAMLQVPAFKKSYELAKRYPTNGLCQQIAHEIRNLGIITE